MMPTAKTPTTSSGKICLTNFQDSHRKSRVSSSVNWVLSIQPRMMTEIAALRRTCRSGTGSARPRAVPYPEQLPAGSEPTRPDGDPGPGVEAFMDVFDAFPGGQPDQDQHPDQDSTLGRDPFLTPGWVKGHQLMQEGLESVHAANGQFDLGVGVLEQVDLEGARDQQEQPAPA